MDPPEGPGFHQWVISMWTGVGTETGVGTGVGTRTGPVVGTVVGFCGSNHPHLTCDVFKTQDIPAHLNRWDRGRMNILVLSGTTNNPRLKHGTGALEPTEPCFFELRVFSPLNVGPVQGCCLHGLVVSMSLFGWCPRPMCCRPSTCELMFLVTRGPR